MINDPIADMLTKIRNAQAAKKEAAIVSYSKLKMNIAKILEKEGYIKASEKKGKKGRRSIELVLSYNTEGESAINSIFRVSKLSQRVYLPVKKIKPVRQGTGIQIISTSKGLMTDKEARKEKIGGEIICQIW